MNAIFPRHISNIVKMMPARPCQFILHKHARSKIAFFCSRPICNGFSLLKPTTDDSAKRLTIQCFRCHQRLLTTSRNRCWQCNAVVGERDLVCLSCGCVQEPKEHLNYFEIFKETPQFDVDHRILNIKFRRLQNLLHPDKFATRPEKEQKYSMEQSSRVNRAYQLLSNSLERGLYLLELYEKPLHEDEIIMSGDFLEDIMEINENITTKGEDIDVVISLRNSNNARMEVLFAELSLSFKEKNVDRAREILAKLKYFVSIDNRLKKAEDCLGISRED